MSDWPDPFSIVMDKEIARSQTRAKAASEARARSPKGYRKLAFEKPRHRGARRGPE